MGGDPRPHRWWFSAEPGGWVARRRLAADEGDGACVVGPTLAFADVLMAICRIEREQAFELKQAPAPAAEST